MVIILDKQDSFKIRQIALHTKHGILSAGGSTKDLIVFINLVVVDIVEAKKHQCSVSAQYQQQYQ